jgi:inhibitor of KinA
MYYKIFPLGENALTIDFGNEISAEKNDLVFNLSQKIQMDQFPGFQECVPAYSSLTIFYNLFGVRQNFSLFPNAFEAIKHFVISKLTNLTQSKLLTGTKFEIPVSFSKEDALDLDFVAESNNLSPREVIDIFLSKTYRVFMIGFLPGFGYMGKIDKKIATGRKQQPRTIVPRGSVGIAGSQTGIYPSESPGGWQIIGRTNMVLFNPKAKSPTLLQAGDEVKFFEAKT